MGLFKKKEENKFKQLIKEKEKQDKKAEKEWETRVNNKYTAENLKAAKKIMTAEAKTIDAQEYERITRELKERLNKQSISEGKTNEES